MEKPIQIIVYGGTFSKISDLYGKNAEPIPDSLDDVEKKDRNKFKTNIQDSIEKLFPDKKSDLYEFTANADIDILEIKDSTNITPKDWSKLSKHLFEQREKYSGFVITHGTNTMSYTASALSLSLGNILGRPVVLTGSHLPIDKYGTDARFNFENAMIALSSAIREDISEIMVCFSNAIYRGCRTVKVSEYDFNAFASPAYPKLGTLKSIGVDWNKKALRETDTQYAKLEKDFSVDILSIELIPGINPTMVKRIIESVDCKGVILKSQGAGSVPTLEHKALITSIEDLISKGKPIVISKRFFDDAEVRERIDECAQMALDAGAISSKDMTDVMAFVKLKWILGRTENPDVQSVKTMFGKNLVGEMQV